MAEMKWDAKAYDGGFNFVTSYGDAVLELLNPQPGERILDIGCGTGKHVAKLSEFGCKVVGIDMDEAMLTEARDHFPTGKFVFADAQTWHSDQPFDAAFSNAALHWIPDLAAVFTRTHENLKPGGRLVFEMGGKGNVKTASDSLAQAFTEITGKELENPKNYLSIGEVSALLEPAGFRVESAWHFDRPTPLSGDDGLRDWYRVFSVRSLSQCPAELHKELLDRAVDLARPHLMTETGWIADYVRLRVKATRS